MDGIGLTMVQLHGDEGPAFCSEVARRTGAKVIKAAAVQRQGRHPRARDLPHRLPPARRPPRRDARRHGGDLRLGARALAPLADPARAQRRPAARERRRGDRRRAPVRRRHGQRHRGQPRASRTPRRSRPSSRRSTRQRAEVEAAGVSSAGRAPLRPLRRPVRPRDAHAGAGRARAGVGRGAAGDAGFRAELDGLLRDFVGRPSPLYLAHRLSEVAGRRLYLKREDLNHTGAHKINNAIGQALLARRMGKRRIIAETGAGPARRRHRDRVRADGPRVRRLHGRGGHPPPGAQRPAHGAARRDRVAGRRRRAHPQGGGVRGDPRLGRPTSTARTTSSARRSARRPTRRSCATCSA